MPLDGARKWLASHDWQIVYVEDGPDGRLNRDTVEIRTGQDEDVELLVLLHEMAHIMLQHEQQSARFNAYDVKRREVTAETAAASAARLLGVDVAAHSELYLASYPGVQPQRNAGMVGRLIADSIKAMR